MQLSSQLELAKAALSSMQRKDGSWENLLDAASSQREAVEQTQRCEELQRCVCNLPEHSACMKMKPKRGLRAYMHNENDCGPLLEQKSFALLSSSRTITLQATEDAQESAAATTAGGTREQPRK